MTNPPTEEREWTKEFDKTFQGEEYGLGFSAMPQPTTASLLVKSFIRKVEAQAEARGIEKGRQQVITEIKKMNHDRDGILGVIPNGELKTRVTDWLNGYKQFQSDILQSLTSEHGN